MWVRWIVIIGMGLSVMASDLCLPALPSIQKSFQVLDSAIQLSYTLYLGGLVLGHVWAGLSADYWGRRKTLLTGLFLGITGSFLCALSSGLFPFMGGRLLQGMGFAAVPLVGRIVLRDLYQGAALMQLISYAAIASSAALATVPFLGAIVQIYANWRTGFYLNIVLHSVYMAWVYVLLPETLPVPKRAKGPKQSLFQKIWALVNNKSFMAFQMCVGLSCAIFVAYVTSYSHLMQTLFGFSVFQQSCMSFGIAVCQICFLAYSASQFKRWGTWHSLTLSIQIIMLGIAALWIQSFFSAHPAFYIVGVALLSTGCALEAANAIPAALGSVRHNIGFAAAFLGAVQLSWGLISSACLALLPESTVLNLAVVASSLCVYNAWYVFFKAKQLLKRASL